MNYLKREYLKLNNPTSKLKIKKKGTGVGQNIGFVIFGGVLTLLLLGNVIGIFPRSIITTLFSVIIFSIVAVGYCLLLGYAGLASLGTAGFIGIGIYSVYFAMERWGLTFSVGLILAVAIAIAVGVGVGFVSLRIEGIYLAIITLGVSEILVYVFKGISSTLSLTREHRKLFFIDLTQTQMQRIIFFIGIVALIGLTCLTKNLMNSPTGRAMTAMKNSTAAAQAFGVSLLKYRLLAFVISVMYAAVAGVIYFLYIGSFMTTENLLTLSTSLNILGAVIIGGTKSLWGAFFGVFLIYGINDLLKSYVPFFAKNGDIMTIVSGVLIVLIVMFYAGGLAQLVGQIRAKARLKKAERRLANGG
ncbi:MAG: branched-chain amino acid ABC transporter permease [Christensenellales bacterium]